MAEFELNGRTFRTGKLNALKQFHVSRRIAPLLPGLLPVFFEISKNAQSGNRSFVESIAQVGPMLQPFADALAALSDESANYVFDTCLGVVQFRQGDSWAQLWVTGGAGVMISGLDDMGVLLPLVIRVIIENLGPFISGFLTSQEGTQAGGSPASDGATSPTAKTGI